MSWLDKLLGRDKKAAGDKMGDTPMRREGMAQERESMADERAEMHEQEASAEREGADREGM